MRSTLWLAALVVTSAADAAPRKGTGKTTPPTTPKAGAKTPPACGVHLLPLAPGSMWRYTPVDAHVAIDDKIKRVAPAVPKQVVVTVKSVDTSKKDTTIVTLEEKLTYDLTKDQKKPIIDERIVVSTIACSAKRFDISPDSFFFNGEPGGYLGITFDKLDRTKGTTLVLNNTGVIGEAEWREDFSGHWTRTPSKGIEVNLGSGGKLELERRITPQPADKVQTPMGEFKTEKLGITTTGRVILDNKIVPFTPKPDDGCQFDACIPSGWISTVWIADGVGVVAAQNSYGAKFILAEYDLK
jgi:hypothetical protein